MSAVPWTFKSTTSSLVLLEPRVSNNHLMRFRPFNQFVCSLVSDLQVMWCKLISTITEQFYGSVMSAFSLYFFFLSLFFCILTFSTLTDWSSSKTQRNYCSNDSSHLVYLRAKYVIVNVVPININDTDDQCKTAVAKLHWKLFTQDFKGIFINFPLLGST